MSRKREGIKNAVLGFLCGDKNQTRTSSLHNQSELGGITTQHATTTVNTAHLSKQNKVTPIHDPEYEKRKKKSDRQKQREIHNRDDPKKPYQQEQALLDETTKRQVLTLSLQRSETSTFTQISRIPRRTPFNPRPVHQELLYKNHTADLKVPWDQRLSSCQTYNYTPPNQHNQQQSYLRQQDRSHVCNVSYPAQRENALQNRPEGSGALPINQRRYLEAQTKNSTSKDIKTTHRTPPPSDQNMKEFNTGIVQEIVVCQYNTLYNEGANAGIAQANFSTTRDNYEILPSEHYQSKYETLERNSNNSFENSREILGTSPASTSHVKTVTEIESDLHNSGATYLRKSGSSKFSNAKSDCTASGSKVSLKMLLSRADRDRLAELEMNQEQQPAKCPSNYMMAVTEKDCVSDKISTQTEQNAHFQNNENFQRQNASQKEIPYRQTIPSIDVGTDVSESTMYHKEHAGQTYFEDKGNVHVQNDGNIPRRNASQQSLTHQHTNRSIEVGIEASEEGGSMYQEERADHAADTTEGREDNADDRNFSVKVDDSHISKKIECIESNSQILAKHIKKFDGSSAYYYFIEENLTRFLLELDKLPVEHNLELKLKRRGAIKYIYELQNKLEQKHLKIRAGKGPLAVSQI